jgi:hypothetical protein
MWKFILTGFFILSSYKSGFTQIPDGKINMFGHDISIDESNYQMNLSIDGKTVLTDQSIWLTQMVLVDGVPVIIGTNNAGGNACESQRFVLSFPPGKNPHLDGPVETCRGVKVTLMAGKIEFSTAATVAMPGEVWTWTVSGALEKTGETAYEPVMGEGWDNLRERTQSHPFDVLKLEEISKQVEKMVGADAKRYMQIMQGVGSGSFEGDKFYGTSCAPHMCGEIEGLLAADIRKKELYLAWKESGEKIKVSPAVTAWPDFAKWKLKSWAAKWR